MRNGRRPRTGRRCWRRTTPPPSACWACGRCRTTATASTLLREMGRHFGVEHTFTRTSCAVYFGAPGVTVPDPYFGGLGPERTGCLKCGACMVGCRTGAKNTLVKNYLWFAERLGVEVIPEREVTDIRPLGAADGADGYVVETGHPGRVAAPAGALLPRGRRRRRRRRPRHQCPAGALQAGRQPAGAERAAGSSGADQQRVAARGDAARRPVRSRGTTWPSARASIPIRTRTSSSSPTASTATCCPA